MVNVCDIQVMKPLLAEHGFHFSKAKGQNFLIAPWVPQSIAEQAGVDETAGVLEIGPGIGSAASLSPVVIVTGLMSAVGYGLYSIFGTFALRKYQPLTVTTYAFLFGAVGAAILCKPAEIVTVISTAPNPAGLVLLLIVTAFVTAVLPYLLYTVGLSHMRASAAAIMASIEPVVATAAGTLVFGEALTIPAFAGIALVLGAIVVLNLKS